MTQNPDHRIEGNHVVGINDIIRRSADMQGR